MCLRERCGCAPACEGRFVSARDGGVMCAVTFRRLDVTYGRARFAAHCSHSAVNDDEGPAAAPAPRRASGGRSGGPYFLPYTVVATVTLLLENTGSGALLTTLAVLVIDSLPPDSAFTTRFTVREPPF